MPSRISPDLPGIASPSRALNAHGSTSPQACASAHRYAGRCAPVHGERYYVSVRESVHEQLAAIANVRSVPLTQVLAEMLKGWQPTPEDAARSRLDADGNAAVWIDAGLHGRLRIAARERGVSIKALVEEALRGAL